MDGNFSFQTTNQHTVIVEIWDDFGDRATVPGNHQSLGVQTVEQRQALFLEFGGADVVCGLHDMRPIIYDWS